MRNQDTWMTPENIRIELRGGQQSMSGTERLTYGDWVHVTRAPNGTAEYVRQAVAGKVVDTWGDEASVELFSELGRSIYTITARKSRLEKLDKAPTFKNATSHIPETAEVLAAKRIVWQHAMKVKRTAGLCSVLEACLEEAGIQKPPPGRVKAQLVFDLEVDVDKVITGADHTNFDELFKKFGVGDMARSFMTRADYSKATVTYEVIPPPPPAPPAPPAAPVGQDTKSAVEVAATQPEAAKPVEVTVEDDEEAEFLVVVH